MVHQITIIIAKRSKGRTIYLRAPASPKKAGAICVANWGPTRSQIEKKVAMKNAAPRKKLFFLPPPAEMLSQLEEEEGVL